MYEGGAGRRMSGERGERDSVRREGKIEVDEAVGKTDEEESGEFKVGGLMDGEGKGGG